MSCNDNDVAPPSTCKVITGSVAEFNAKWDYQYDAEGFIKSQNIEFLENDSTTSKYTNGGFKILNGRLVGLENPDGLKEEYVYTNELVSAINIQDPNDPAYADYQIKVENDANGRIAKMTDNKGRTSTVKRDTRGNILEVEIKDQAGKQVYLGQYSGYDGKKTLEDTFKGWPINVLGYYANYMQLDYNNFGAGGNPAKFKASHQGVPAIDHERTYEYNSAGFPTKISITTDRVNATPAYSFDFGYSECK
ncbi:hypothetical protein DVG78_29380 [Runella aurantiaca]|uniref:DUF4595 domain-containing protein n=1 Tax=Runella aurantiaca TaxID=2282308 RepID=A0A369HXU0_9BACT|nr:hypothetical protein DVG78_29380 [Runella aurantiaca]